MFLRAAARNRYALIYLKIVELVEQAMAVVSQCLPSEMAWGSTDAFMTVLMGPD